MLTLYVETGCPYSARALKALDELGLKAQVKNISAPGVIEELVKRGGILQMPYLADSATGKEMYDSEKIAAYLKKTYGTHAVL